MQRKKTVWRYVVAFEANLALRAVGQHGDETRDPFLAIFPHEALLVEPVLRQARHQLTRVLGPITGGVDEEEAGFSVLFV